MSLKPKKVRKVVAQNPVAAAMAWSTMVAEARKFKIQMYLLDEGAKAEELVGHLARYIALVLLSVQEAEKDKINEAIPEWAFWKETAEIGLAALTYIAEHGFVWRKQINVWVDDSMDATALLVRKLKGQHIRRAQIRLDELMLMNKDVEIPGAHNLTYYGRTPPDPI